MTTVKDVGKMIDDAQDLLSTHGREIVYRYMVRGLAEIGPISQIYLQSDGTELMVAVGPTKFCTHCHAVNFDSCDYCTDCGWKFEEEDE